MFASVSHIRPSRLKEAGRPDGGYTIVEVLLVIVILAVLGTIAGPRFFDNEVFDERAYYDELVGALRYAQKTAVASGCSVRVIVGVSAYALSQQQNAGGHCDSSDVSFPLPVRLSTGEVMAGSAPAAITTAPTLTFVYNALGQTNLAANQSLAVGARALTIQADSGLVITP